jgi:hypothetical protein
MVFHWYYVNDLHTTHAVVYWVTTETEKNWSEFFSLFMHRRPLQPSIYDCLFVGKPQEKVLMNIAASFPSIKKPRYVDQEKSRQYD